MQPIRPRRRSRGGRPFGATARAPASWSNPPRSSAIAAAIRSGHDGPQDADMALGRAGATLRQVLALKTVAQFAHGRGLPLGHLVALRVDAVVDLQPQLARPRRSRLEIFRRCISSFRPCWPQGRAGLGRNDPLLLQMRSFSLRASRVICGAAASCLTPIQPVGSPARARAPDGKNPLRDA